VGAPPSQLTVQNLIGSIVDEITAKHRDVETGIELFIRQDFEGARNAMQRAVQNNPELPPASVLMAKLYILTNNARGANAELDTAASAAPEDPESYIIKGDIALQQSQPAGAQVFYDLGLSKLQSYNANQKRKNLLLVRAYSGMAFVAQAGGDWKTAESHLRKWLEITPEDNSGKERLAYVLFQQGTKETMEAAYTLCAEIYKSDPENRLRPEIVVGGWFDSIRKDKPRAKRLMEQAQKNDPAVQTQLAVARWALESGEMELARKAAAAAGNVDGKSLESLLINGLMHRYERKEQEALKFFTDAHLLSPINPLALTQLALILIESDNPADKRRAVEYAQIAASVYSRYEQNHARESALTLAWVLHKMGRSRDAGQIINNVLKEPGTVDSASLYYAAEVMHALGQDVPAKKILDAILDQGKNFLNRDRATELRTALQ
jgi:tetratricopeptide (TPR) repeat protein